MKNWFKSDPPLPDLLVEEARANLPILEEFRGSIGWGLVKGWCVGTATGATEEWAKGVTQERQIALASQVSTLGWVIDLIESRMSIYRKVLESVGEGSEGSEVNEDEKPFTNPFEPIGQL